MLKFFYQSFIYFLQKKGWLGLKKNDDGTFKKWGTGDKNFIRNLFIKKYCNYEIKYKYLPRRKGDLDTIFTDNQKAKKILNWKPKKGLKEIAISTFNYYNRWK